MSGRGGGESSIGTSMEWQQAEWMPKGSSQYGCGHWQCWPSTWTGTFIGLSEYLDPHFLRGNRHSSSLSKLLLLEHLFSATVLLGADPLCWCVSVTLSNRGSLNVFLESALLVCLISLLEASSVPKGLSPCPFSDSTRAAIQAIDKRSAEDDSVASASACKLLLSDSWTTWLGLQVSVSILVTSGEAGRFWAVTPSVRLMIPSPSTVCEVWVGFSRGIWPLTRGLWKNLFHSLPRRRRELLRLDEWRLICLLIAVRMFCRTEAYKERMWWLTFKNNLITPPPLYHTLEHPRQLFAPQFTLK